MSILKKYTPFFLATLLMYVVLLVIYPHYCYYIDPDGTAYLTISQRYANGEFAKAVNGLWSPLGCWLTAAFIRTGVSVIAASWLVNILAATGFLFIAQSLFLKMDIPARVRWIFSISFALYLCYAVFWQSFDDLWECFLLLASFRILLADSFITRPALWVCYGAIGAVAYFAKAYAFPFFILNTVCCVYFIAAGNRAQWLKVCFVSLGIMFLISFPWIYALHIKYGRWLTSTAGPLNMTWFLVGHPYHKPGIGLLLPPAYPDSISYWEDPWFVNGIMPQFWNSWHLAGLQVLRLGLNAYKLLRSTLQLSVFFPVIGIIALFYLRSPKIKSLFAGKEKLIVISFLLFPLGYIPVDFQARFLWYMLPLSMIIWFFYTQRASLDSKQGILIPLFALSLLIYPAWGMIGMYNEGVRDHEAGEALKQLHIHGSFASMARPGLENQRLQRLAYFSGNQLYSTAGPGYTEQELLHEMQRYHVQYFFVYAGSPAFTINEAKSFPEITNGRIPGLRVYKVMP